MTAGGGILLNLAAGLTQKLFEEGAEDLTKAIADPQREALQRAYERALGRMLGEIAREMRAAAGEVSEADLLAIREVLGDLFGREGVYEELLGVAVRREALDLKRWALRFEGVRGPDRLKEVEFDLATSLGVLQTALTGEMEKAAKDAESPLFNWVTLGTLDGLWRDVAGMDAKLDRLGETVFARSLVEETRALVARGVELYRAELYRKLAAAGKPAEPYKYLDAFGMEDRSIFFGRDDLVAELHKTVTSKRLMVVHGQSGAGKSSLVQAGLMVKLVQDGRLPVYVQAYQEPVTAIKKAMVSGKLETWPAPLTAMALRDFLGLVRNCLGGEELVLVIDQFEGYFVQGPWPTPAGVSLVDELADCWDDESLKVRFVLALRGDYLSRLGIFKRRLPGILRNEVWVGPVSQDQAALAITGPVRVVDGSVVYEDGLLETLLDDLGRGEIELPHLQIVCGQLYDALGDGEKTIKLAMYEGLDRTAGVMAGYLRKVLGQLGGTDAGTAKEVLKALVSGEETRRQVNRERLAQGVEADNASLERVLAHLVDARLVRRDETEDGVVYEVSHEYLIQEIVLWFAPDELAARQVEEMLAREVVNWRVHGWTMPAERVRMLRDCPEKWNTWSPEIQELVLSSAVRSDTDLEQWIGLAGSERERILITIIQNGVIEEQRTALKGLGIIWDLKDVSRLGDPSAEIRRIAAEAMGVLGDARGVVPLSAVCEDKHVFVRVAAVEALGKLGDLRAVEPLIAALKDESLIVRLGATRALGKLGDLRAVIPLLGVFYEWDLRSAIIWALVKLGAETVEPLIVALENENGIVRHGAVEALGTLGDSRAVKPLIDFLHDGDTSARRSCVNALRKIGTEEAVAAVAAFEADK